MGACFTRVNSKNSIELKNVLSEENRIVSIQKAIDISPVVSTGKRTPRTRTNTTSKRSSRGISEEWTSRGKMISSKSTSQFKRPRFQVKTPLSLSNLDFSNFDSDLSVNANRYWIDEESDIVPPGLFEDRPKTTHIHGSFSDFSDVTNTPTPYDFSPSMPESPAVGGSQMSPAPSDSSPLRIRPILEPARNPPKMETDVQSLPLNILRRRASPSSNIEFQCFVECRDQLINAKNSSNLSIEKFELLIQRAEELFETARYSLKDIPDEQYKRLWPHMCILRKQVKQWKAELKKAREPPPEIQIPASFGVATSPSLPEHVL